ncbi:hypothetical protein HDU97_007328 [Phlyctochytrium planicorne]|nr:hypothetical protein HDU97_007328 [Phlyctochytrium planicorne]
MTRRREYARLDGSDLTPDELDFSGKVSGDDFVQTTDEKELERPKIQRQWTDVSIQSSITGDLGVKSNRRSGFMGNKLIKSALAASTLLQPDSPSITWTPSHGKAPCGKQLSDSKQEALIHGLARALLFYGAPLYRVERRIHEAGEGLQIATSVMCFPSAILITLGDSMSSQPPRTHFLEVTGGNFNMGKLEEVDKLSIRCANLRTASDAGTDESLEDTVKKKCQGLNPCSGSRESVENDALDSKKRRFEILGRGSYYSTLTPASSVGFESAGNVQKAGSILASSTLAEHHDHDDSSGIVDLQTADRKDQETNDTSLHFAPLNNLHLTLPGSFSDSKRADLKDQKGQFANSSLIRDSPSLSRIQSPNTSRIQSPSLSRRPSETGRVGKALEPGKPSKRLPSVISNPAESKKDLLAIAEDDDEDVDSIEKILKDLDHVVTKRISYRALIRGSAFAMQASMITLLIYRGSLADATLASLLGSFVGMATMLTEKANLQSASDFMIALLVAVFARFAERGWPGNYAIIMESLSSSLAENSTVSAANTTLPFPDGGFANETSLITDTLVPSVNMTVYEAFNLVEGVYACYTTYSLASLAQLLPGAQITLGMLEISTSPVAGSVRIFQSFIRALKLGYGLTLGSKLAIWIMTSLEIPGADFGIRTASRKHCPNFVLGIQHLEPWRYFAFIPMNIAILVALNSNMKQWPQMTAASLCAFIVSLTSTTFFSPEIAAMISAFVLGVISNVWARATNDIAIASVLAGISWLVPGSVGVQSTFGLFQASSNWTPGATFGMDMITRAMSIAVGLYMANAVIFPIKMKRMESSIEP